MSDSKSEIEVVDADNGPSGKRVRRTVERLSKVYDRAFDASKEKKVAKVEGNGVPLYDITRVKDAFQRSRISQDMAKEIHLLCYKSVGRASARKGDIRRFSGFSGEDDGEEARKRVALAEKMRLDRLKVVCDLFAVPTVARSKREMSEALVGFLRIPQEIEETSFKTLVLRGGRKSAKGKVKVTRGSLGPPAKEDEGEGQEKKVVRRKRKIIVEGDDEDKETIKRRRVAAVGSGLESVSVRSEEERAGLEEDKIDQEEGEMDEKKEKVDQEQEETCEKIDEKEKKIGQKKKEIDQKEKKIDMKRNKIDQKDKLKERKEKADKKEKKVKKNDQKEKTPRKAAAKVVEGDLSSLSSLSSTKDAREARGEAADEAEVERRVREVLAGADPQRTTLNQVCEAVAGLVPGLDLLEGRPRLKAIIRAVIDGSP